MARLEYIGGDENRRGAVAFLAFPEQKDFLILELKERFSWNGKGEWFGDLLLVRGDGTAGLAESAPYFASCVLLEPFFLHFESIGEAAKSLCEIQRNWAAYSFDFFRRATLIQEKLPYIRLKPRDFIFEIPPSPMGIFTLIDEKTILASALTSSPVPLGQVTFVEDHENPPSRAYLKLQEALTWAKFYGSELPCEGTRCFDAGACPGGWTWVLRKLGAEVFAVDRAPLCDELMADEKVEFLAHDAFTLEPDAIGEFDWVFSDVICYPERLLEWVKKWIESGKTKNMICTIKMQGSIDWELVKKFAEIEGSRVLHLRYNKHELTWIWMKK